MQQRYVDLESLIRNLWTRPPTHPSNPANCNVDAWTKSTEPRQEIVLAHVAFLIVQFSRMTRTKSNWGKDDLSESCLVFGLAEVIYTLKWVLLLW